MAIKKWLLIVLCVILSPAYADISERKDVQAFIQEMVKQHGFDQAYLTAVFKKVTINDNIIELMDRPAKRTKPWYEYKPLFITNAQVIAGVKFWKDNEAALNKAEKEYGVPPQDYSSHLRR